MTRPCDALEQGQQPGREQERCDHMGLRRQFQPVDGAFVTMRERARVVHDHIQPVAGLVDLVGDTANAVESSQIGDHHPKVAVSRLAFDEGAGLVGPAPVTTEQHHIGAHRRETPCRRQPESRRRAGHQRYLPTERPGGRVAPAEEAPASGETEAAEAAHHRQFQRGVSHLSGDRAHRPQRWGVHEGLPAWPRSATARRSTFARRPSAARSPMRRNKRASNGAIKRTAPRGSSTAS